MAEKRKIRTASLQNHMAHRSERESAGQVYSESEPDVGAALESSGDVGSALQGAAQMQPDQRAELGGLVGAQIGNRVAGAHGALIGAAIASDGVRSLGLAQSGENEIAEKQSQVMQALQTAKLVDEQGLLSFKDGAELDLSDPTAEELPNTAPDIVGKPARGVYETDPTNPFTARTAKVAKPLAYYIAGGMLQMGDFKDKAALKVVDSTASMFVNAFQLGTKDINTVYGRAKEVTKKLGVKQDQMKQFFYDNRDSFSEKDASDIKQGLSLLFGK